jgi:hypothetical protein
MVNVTTSLPEPCGEMTDAARFSFNCDLSEPAAKAL